MGSLDDWASEMYAGRQSCECLGLNCPHNECLKTLGKPFLLINSSVIRNDHIAC